MATFAHLLDPGRVLQQHATDGDQVELIALQARDQLIQAARLGADADVGDDEFLIEADAADGDRTACRSASWSSRRG